MGAEQGEGGRYPVVKIQLGVGETHRALRNQACRRQRMLGEGAIVRAAVKDSLGQGPAKATGLW